MRDMGGQHAVFAKTLNGNIRVITRSLPLAVVCLSARPVLSCAAM